jgi:hypothetical protein
MQGEAGRIADRTDPLGHDALGAKPASVRENGGAIFGDHNGLTIKAVSESGDDWIRQGKSWRLR